MLYISLVFSTVLLVLANVFARSAAFSGTKIVALSLGSFCSAFFLLCALPAVAVQTLLFCFATLAWRLSGRGSAFFTWLSCGATLVSYGFAAWFVVGTEREYERLRDRYPYESLAERLPVAKPVATTAPLAPAVNQSLVTLESTAGGSAIFGRRGYQLRRLHEEKLDLFVNSPGFGVARMDRPMDYNLASRVAGRPVPKQPGIDLASIWSPGQLESPAGDVVTALQAMLESGIKDFANDDGFGYVKDREHVAGFESHRFSEVPGLPNTWTVERLSLVSLLLSEAPAVYVSETLPRMDHVRKTPTRPLNRFEEFGLSRLKNGEDLVASQEGHHLRMLGSVRGSGECIVCHGGTPGDLLGAFSYILQSVKDIPRKDFSGSAE